MKKNIMIFAGYYLPGVKGGGPIKSISNLVNQLSSEFNFYIVADDRDLGDKKKYDNIITDKWVKKDNYFVYYTNKKELATKKIKDLMKSVDIDILYLNSLYDLKWSIIPLLLEKLNMVNVEKVIIAPRGNLSLGAIMQKKTKKILYIKFFNLFNLGKNIKWHATNLIEKEYIQNQFGKNSNVIIAENLTSDYSDIEYNKLLFKEKNKLKIIFLSRIHPMKNLKMALKLMNNIKGKVLFDIYGPIEDVQYWEECLDIINKLKENITVNYKGILSHREILKTFNNYHIFLFPTLGENFGHVISEALISGCPVITSDQTPWTNLKENNAGWSISLDNEEKFTEAIQYYLDMSDLEYQESSRFAFNYGKSKASSTKKINSYIDLFQYDKIKYDN